MNVKLLIVTLALTLAACSGGGSDSPNVIAAPTLVPTSPTTANLTLVNGNGYQCFVDQGTVAVRASTLYCWGSNANLGLSSATPVAFMTKNTLGFVPVAITNVKAYSDVLCLQTQAFHLPYSSGAMGQGTYCFGKFSSVNDGSFGGQQITRTPFVSGEIAVAQAPMVGADMDWFSYLGLTPFYAGNNAGTDSVESCTVSGNTYTCPSVTLTLVP